MKSFTEHAMTKDGWVRRYIGYTANRDGVSIEEAAVRSLARIYKLIMDSNKPLAIMTAFRGERDLFANRLANKTLEDAIRAFGWGYTPVVGTYEETIRDTEGNETGEKRKVEEESYFIVGSDDPKQFTERLQELCNKFEQESVIVKYPNDENAYLLYSNGSAEPLGVWSQNRLSQYYTRMKKGPADRRFTFEAAGDSSRMTLLAVDKYWESH